MLQILSSLILLLSAHICYVHTEEHYLELTDSNFDDTLRKYDLVLVKFYAEWCGHCKRMAPEFAEAAKILKANEPPVQLVKLNCPNYQSVCEKYSVSGYPTLKIFRNGEFHEDYNGGRDADGIVKYMKARAGPASAKLESESEIDRLRKGSSSLFVAFVPSDTDPDLELFKNIASKNRDKFTFAHVIKSGAKSVKRFLPKLIQTKMESPFIELNLPVSQDTLELWIEENWGGHLAWDQGDSSLLDNQKSAWITIYFGLDYDRDAKGTNYVRNRLLKSIKELKESGSKSKFAMSSAEKNSYQLQNNFNVNWSKGNKPIVTIMSQGKKYVMPDEFSYDSFKQFVKDFEAGKIEPYLKTEPKPDSQPDSVVKVVASTFDDIVMDKSKFVMIEFFAPWCGHCKSLKPIYEELAEKLKSHTDVIIAAMDATANDVPNNSFEVRGFPTLYWVDKDNNIKQYDKGRDLESFISFIETEIGRSIGKAKEEL